jgi:hypothetical protein
MKEKPTYICSQGFCVAIAAAIVPTHCKEINEDWFRTKVGFISFSRMTRHFSLTLEKKQDTVSCVALADDVRLITAASGPHINLKTIK